MAVCFFAYYVCFISYGVATKAPQTIFYALFVGAAAAVVAFLYDRTPLSRVVLWGLAAWGFAHMAGGLVAFGGEILYERSLGSGELRLDKVVHFFGFGFATLAAYELVRRLLAPAAPPRSVAIMATFIGLGIGALNETLEFVITLLPTESNVGGFSNTGWDLVANAAGALTAASFGSWRDRRKR